MARHERINHSMKVTKWSKFKRSLLVFVKRIVSPFINLIKHTFPKYRYAAVNVLGNSMSPQFNDNQWVIVDTTSSQYRIGDIVAFIPPVADYILVKRVTNQYGDDYYVRGDNSIESIDSRHFGAITKENIIGDVVL